MLQTFREPELERSDTVQPAWQTKHVLHISNKSYLLPQLYSIFSNINQCKDYLYTKKEFIASTDIQNYRIMSRTTWPYN